MAISEIPATLNVTCAAQLARRVLVELKDIHGEAYSTAAFASFHGRMRHETSGETVELGVGVSSLGENTLDLFFPALPAGVWRYEVWATNEDGRNDRFIIGLYSVLDAIVGHQPSAETPYTATLVIGEDNAVVSAQFHATTDAMLYAQQAEATLGRVDEAAEAAKVEVLETGNRIKEEMRSLADDAADSAEQAAQSAALAAEKERLAAASAEKAQGYATETSENVKVANAFLARWEETVYTLIWVGDNGTWHVGLNGSPHAIDTGIRAQGENGKSPIIGNDNCWWLWDDETESYQTTELKAIPEDGKSPYINTLGHWVQWDAEEHAYVDTGVQAQGKNGLNGSQIVRLLVDTYENIPTEGETCNGGYYYYVPLENPTPTAFYAEYAWIESADGTAGWVRVGEVNDISTSEIYGLVKLATDRVVSAGAPVGVNETGQMAVPLADSSVPGSVRLSSTEAPERTAAMQNIGARADGSIAVLDGNYSRYGAVRPSSGEMETETADMQNIAKTNTGRLVTRRATRKRYGAVKLGSDFSTLNPIPYQHGISSTANGELANNLLYSGALQHRKRASWLATGSALARELSERFAPDASASYFNSTDFYMGLLTTDSFTQSAENGLALSAASETLLGGVMLGGVSGGATSSVPTGSTVFTYLNENYLDKRHIESNYWTAATIQAWAANTPVTDVWVREQHAQMDRKIAETYLSKADAARTYYTLTSATADKKTLENSIAAVKTFAQNTITSSVSQLRGEVNHTINSSVVLRGNSGIAKLAKVSSADFAKLSALSPDTLYIVTA